VIAPGTGLGEAFITRRGREYLVHPSEGGHTDFAPNNQFEIGLLEYLMRELDHVSYEEVCSGIGIRHIHQYVEKTSLPETAAWRAKEREADDLVRLLADAALKKENSGCNTCTATFETFGSVLGAEAGNLALKVLATGGVYIGGGIAPNILPLLRAGPFMDSFRKKGRLSRIVTRIPVHVILNLDVALLGAARSGMERVRLEQRVGTRKVFRS
jgi:glucokinase